MALRQSDLIEIKRIKGKGRGVFAQQFIPEGTEIERVPVLVMPITDIWNGSQESRLADYVFMWGKDTVAVALGYGSLYNHSYEPNARYDDVGRQTKVFTAIRDIQKGEEITVNYNGEPEDRSDVGFPVIEGSGPALNGHAANKSHPRRSGARCESGCSLVED